MLQSLLVFSLSYEVARLPFAFILALITVLDMDTLFYQWLLSSYCLDSARYLRAMSYKRKQGRVPF